MSLSVKPGHIRRYRDLAWLLMRYGRADLVEQGGLSTVLADDGPPPEATAKAEELASDLERMGPTFVKLGQLLSTRPDILPAPYLEALARLQDQVEPFPFADVEEVVSSELGVRLSKAFSRFDEEPMAAASLAQVHRAALRDGRPVAVKVQRPGIREQVAEDFAVFEEVVGVLGGTDLARSYDLSGTLEELRASIARELDYLREASHLRTLGENLRKFPSLFVPQPVDGYTTSRVLTMDLVEGTRIDQLSGVVRVDVEGEALAEELFRAYLHQVLVDGFFHADPHPGNILLTRDHRLALLDLGMVGHVTPDLQERLLKLLLAVSDGDGEDAVRVMVRMSRVREGADVETFSRRVASVVAENRRAALEDIQVGQVVLELCRLGGASGVVPPAGLTLLGKTLLNLDPIGRALDPAFDPNAAIRRHAGELMQRRMWRAASPTGLLSTLLETKELAEQMPGRVNRILETVADNDLQLHLRGIDTEKLVYSVQKLGNRIAAGLIVAALVVGAALMMRVQTEFQLFGYPGLAMLFFLAAAAIGLWILWDILRHDRERRRTSS